LAEGSSGSQEILIRVASTTSVVAHDYSGLDIADEMFVFVVYKNELCAAVHKNVVDLMLDETDVDSRYDRTGADDPLQCLWENSWETHATVNGRMLSPAIMGLGSLNHAPTF